MHGKIYKLLPEHITREINKHLQKGGRYSFAPAFSSHNPNHLKDRNRDICKRYNEIKDIVKISEEFGITQRWVRSILKENGITIQLKTISRVNEVKMMLKLGMGVTAIKKKTGYSRPWIYKIKKEEEL